jgi:hypothetical protein
MLESGSFGMPAPDTIHETQADVIGRSQRPVAKPFVVELRQDRKQPNGSFVPVSSLKLMEEFRTTGLLEFLAPEDLKTLMYLLTFLSPEGHCQVTQPILTSAMRQPSDKVKQRMHRLGQLRWQGEPVIVETPHQSGIFTFSLHPRLVAYEHLTVSQPYPTAPPRMAIRQAVVDHSRATYGRPRDEVEKQVAAQMGYDANEDDGKRKLRQRLENAGLTGEQAREVMRTQNADVIAQQLDWLPYRHAKNPAGYLLAAIEGCYEEPKAIRLNRLLREHQERNLKQRRDFDVQPDEATRQADVAATDGCTATIESLEPGDTPIDLTPRA